MHFPKHHTIAGHYFVNGAEGGQIRRIAMTMLNKLSRLPDERVVLHSWLIVITY
jgi:hypothetical protein